MSYHPQQCDQESSGLQGVCVCMREEHNGLKSNSAFVISIQTDSMMCPQVRTTAPEKYRVKPSNTSCEPGASVDIVVSLHGGRVLHLSLHSVLISTSQMFPNVQQNFRVIRKVQSIKFPKC